MSSAISDPRAASKYLLVLKLLFFFVPLLLKVQVNAFSFTLHNQNHLRAHVHLHAHAHVHPLYRSNHGPVHHQMRRVNFGGKPEEAPAPPSAPLFSSLPKPKTRRHSILSSWSWTRSSSSSSSLNYKSNDDDDVADGVTVDTTIKDLGRPPVPTPAPAVSASASAPPAVSRSKSTERVLKSSPIQNLITIESLEDFNDCMYNNRDKVVAVRFFSSWCKVSFVQ